MERKGTRRMGSGRRKAGQRKQPLHPEKVNIRGYAMGRDVVFLVTGGEAHVGAAATAYWPEGEDGVRSGVMSLPGHREDDLAAELAMMAAQALRRTAVVVAGIHLHRPSAQEIEEIVAEARERMRQVLVEWEDRAKESGANGETSH
ncbi:hypothetical protein [Cohnella hongkongensis]|uniref:Prenylated flavin chaperone LpdD-like domain-containing protein n=1 Tax=Cohnella hongkongensis TaxID=178337 RepID=A0ABV9FB05_9BACL